MKNLIAFILVALLFSCKGKTEKSEASETAAPEIHQGYSDTADQYEVDGFVISNVDVHANLWNPRGKTDEQLATRAKFLLDSYDYKRPTEDEVRVKTTREKYADAITMNSVMPSTVGVVNTTPEEFAKGLKRNHDAGYTLVSTTLFAFPGDGEMELMDRVNKSIEVIEQNGYVLVNAVEDIRRAKNEGKMAVTLNSQGADFAIEDLSIMNTLYEKGLRVCNFVYNKNNALAGGGEKQDSGVTKLGEGWVKRCNDLGIVVDVAHSSNQTVLDAARLSTKPIVASHACSAKLYDIGRNINDEAIKAIGETNGVFAITGVGSFLNNKGIASPKEYALHVEHVAKLIGRDKTAFSTDYMHGAKTFFENNVSNFEIYPPEMGYGSPASNLAAEHIWDVVAVLEDTYGWSDSEIKGFLGENLLRVYEANWK